MSSTPYPISLIIIASNEEERLPKCLASIQGMVSETIAVINDCKDDTQKIFEQAGAKVFTHPWQGSTHQKNVALQYAKEKWVLSLDADEVVTPELAQAIKNFFDEGKDALYDAAEFPRLSCFLGKWIRHGDWYPDRVLRLFKKQDTVRFDGGKDHECIFIQDTPLTRVGKIYRFHHDLLHYTYKGKNEMDEMILKMPRFGNAHLLWQEERKMKWNPLKPFSRALWRFFRGYILKKGFLDGYPGLFIAVTLAYACFYKYSKLYEAKVKRDSFKLSR